MKRVFLCLVLLLASGTAFAHGGLEHVMGVVARINGNSLDVKSMNGKTATVTVTAETHWMRGQSAIKAGDLHTGDRVVIHAKPVNGKLTAVEVAVGTGSQSH